MKNFVEEHKWRGMIHDITPGTEEELKKGFLLRRGKKAYKRITLK